MQLLCRGGVRLGGCPVLMGSRAHPTSTGMTENQMLALIGSVMVLALLLFRNWHRLPREGILWKTAIWLAIFLGVGLFYQAFGPF